MALCAGGGIEVERKVHLIEVVLPAQQVYAHEMAPLPGLGPEAELRLHHPVFPLAVIAQRPPVVVAGHVHRPPAAEGEFHAQIDRGRRVVNQVRLQADLTAGPRALQRIDAGTLRVCGA